MLDDKFTLHRRAEIALNELPTAEQTRVSQALSALTDLPRNRWVEEGATRVPGDAPVYLFPADASLRIVVLAPEGQRPTVLDIVRHETLKTFAKTAS